MKNIHYWAVWKIFLLFAYFMFSALQNKGCRKFKWVPWSRKPNNRAHSSDMPQTDMAFGQLLPH